METPLRNEKVQVRMIPRPSTLFTEKNHVLAGGMAKSTLMSFTVPRDASGAYAQVLDESEREWAEGELGMERGAMSPHKSKDNFWSSRNPLCVVEVGREGLVLDLSNVEDYIRYKILLLNKAVICDSIESMESRPKSSYLFVLVHKAEELKSMSGRVGTKVECYKLFGKMEDDAYKMKTVIELLDSTVLSANTSVEWLKEQCVEHIDDNASRFLQVASDPLLEEKIFVKKCVDAGIVSNRSNRLFIRKGDVPMCDSGEEATLAKAAKWISDPRRQELRLLLETQLNGGETPAADKKKK